MLTSIALALCLKFKTTYLLELNRIDRENSIFQYTYAHREAVATDVEIVLLYRATY